MNPPTQQVTPDLKLRFPGGKEDLPSRYRGNVLLLLIMSIRCGSCAKMASLLNALTERFGASGFQALGVAVNPDALDTLPAFLETSGAKFPFAFCPGDEVAQFLNLPKHEPVRIPLIAFLDRRGRVHGMSCPRTEFYENAEANFPQLVQQLLEQPASPEGEPER